MSETDLETNMDELIQPSSRRNKNRKKGKNVLGAQKEKNSIMKAASERFFVVTQFDAFEKSREWN